MTNAAEALQEPALARFRAAVSEIYGTLVSRVVLFGSRARGDCGDGSDYDVAVFLEPLQDRWAEIDRLADLGVRLMDDSGVVFDAKAFAAARYDDDSPLMHEIRRDGIEL